VGMDWIWANWHAIRSLLYVEADARMETYEDKETGAPRSNLSLIASMLFS
jgi:hypothetical protein